MPAEPNPPLSPKMIAVKVHNSYRKVVALCDSNLINKKFEEGNRQLHLRENFYKERVVEKEEAVRIIIKEAKEDASFNIVGEESIAAAIEAGIINSSHVHKIQGIPFILTLM